MTEPIEITVLKLFREFNDPPAVAKYLGISYPRVLHYITQEYKNQEIVKELERMDIKDWPNRFAQSQTRQARWARAKKEKVRLGLVEPEQKKDRVIGFGYGNNEFLKGDVVERNTHKHDDEVALRRSGNKYRTNRDTNPSLWNM